MPRKFEPLTREELAEIERRRAVAREIARASLETIDPDQLFNLIDDPNELNNLASKHPLSVQFRKEVEAKFDIARINAEVLRSQQSRHLMFEALKCGSHFPWDFQPLRDASEQYTRNHMSVTERDLQSRFPKAPEIEDKRRQ